jgi:hypothetical protein
MSVVLDRVRHGSTETRPAVRVIRSGGRAGLNGTAWTDDTICTGRAREMLREKAERLPRLRK